MLRTILPISIRAAKWHDMETITAIYNHAVLSTTVSFDTEPQTPEERKPWFEIHGNQYPLLVAEADSEVVGWASLSPWSARCAYRSTAEISIYIAESWRGQGIGKQLMVAILKAGCQAGIHTIIARIAEGNPISIKLHEKVGFEHIGIMKEVGFKFGKYLDVYMMQKILQKKKDNNAISV